MKTSWQNIGNIFAEPSGLFKQLSSKPRWGTAYLLICLAYILVAWGRAPYEEHLVSESGQLTDIIGYRIGLVITLSTMKSGWLLIEALLIGALLTTASRLFKIPGTVKFRTLYASLIHLFLIRAFGDIINTGLLCIFRDVSDVTAAADLQLLPGLHQLLFFFKDGELGLLLSSFHVFSLWEIICLTIAIETIGKVSRVRALIVTAGILVVNVMITLVFLIASAS